MVLLFRKSSRPQAIHPLSGSTEVPPSTRRPPFILPWGWTARLYDLPPPLARLAHTEVVNLHPAALSAYLLCLSRSLPTSDSSSLFHSPPLLLSVLSILSPVPLPLSSHHRHLPPRGYLQPHADISNAPPLSHRLSDTHARYRWMDTDTYYTSVDRTGVRAPSSTNVSLSRSARTRVYTILRKRKGSVIPSTSAVVSRPYRAPFLFPPFLTGHGSRMVVSRTNSCQPMFQNSSDFERLNTDNPLAS